MQRHHPRLTTQAVAAFERALKRANLRHAGKEDQDGSAAIDPLGRSLGQRSGPIQDARHQRLDQVVVDHRFVDVRQRALRVGAVRRQLAIDLSHDQGAFLRLGVVRQRCALGGALRGLGECSLAACGGGGGLGAFSLSSG